ncbi:MAG TPA: SbcC/MukB-like Walker B domain-containing protein, partial [Longimicrobium sp.]|nr:SbcC/MukB-like Walker B domain-containing protein [Longimicrobium sp.]
HDLPQLQAVHDRLLAARREEEERARRHDAAGMAAEAVETAAREVQRSAGALERATDAAPYLRGRGRAEVEAVGAALREVLDGVRAVADHVERLEEIRRGHAERTHAAGLLRAQVEALAPRIARADERVRTLDASIRALEDQLRRADVDRREVAEKVRALNARLEEIAAQDQEAKSAIDRNAGAIEKMVGQHDDLADQVRSARLRMEAEETTLRRRVEAYPTLEEYAVLVREGHTGRAAYQLLEGAADTSTLEAAAERAGEELRAAFMRAQGAFEEMSPTLDGVVLRFAYVDGETSLDRGEMRLDEIFRALEDERARKETLLEEEDRKLIEQLMLREVVDAIRAAIAQTRRWVDDVNRTLAGMRLFKGGIMRLQWKVRVREAADAFDPARLDDLLSQRGIALDEARREELLEIFRTMVSDIRRRNREKELHEDYRTALLRMVDYTQWYTLTVERRDEGGRWVPLTRRLYGQGSGGRRTLDLLLPLIAAVSARLEAADPWAPRLIGFDEAFAGVDDRNAAEIYGLLSELGFCWIMATEKTTGIGENVRGSATYELLTDGATVAPVLSLWDGERRYEFVGDELLGVQVAARTASASAAEGAHAT